MAAEGRRSLAEACAELARTMAHQETVPQLVGVVARQVTEILAVAPGAVLLDNLDGILSTSPSDDKVISKLLAAERGLGAGPTIEAVEHRATTRAHTLVDVGPAWPQWTLEARALGVGAWLSVAATAPESTVVVVAASTRPRHWRKSEVAALEVLANLAAGWATQQHELVEVRRTAAQLQGALESRVVIEQAKGVLAGELGCGIDQAYVALRDHARRHSVTVRSVAHAVVELGLRPPLDLPGAVRTGRPRHQGAGQP